MVGQVTFHADVVRSEPGSDGIPDDQGAIEDSLDSAFGGPRGTYVGGLISPDYQRANVQLLMNRGDNKPMRQVVDAADGFLAEQPFPAGVKAEWAGETYLNLVWQDKMVSGMLKAFLTTFAVVFVLMVVLFRSLRWAFLAILPLSVTILLVYGAIGFSGKDYDMPIAVLSTLVLGIAIDFAIHFIQRYREMAKQLPPGRSALGGVFEEPARAITRNALIIALGFVPMFFASLTPYVILGILMASIMVVSWLVSLVLLPAVIAVFQKPDGQGVEAQSP